MASTVNFVRSSISLPISSVLLIGNRLTPLIVAPVGLGALADAHALRIVERHQRVDAVFLMDAIRALAGADFDLLGMPLSLMSFWTDEQAERHLTQWAL
jgi:hypothetical protein